MESKKYNKTLHLPWSPGKSSDDKVAKSVDSLLNTQIIITEKLDGSNVSLERNGVFARTHAYAPTHPSFDQLKSFHAAVKHLIPLNTQLFGENCFALHSIAYDFLPAYFLLFGARYLTTSTWASWSDVENWSKVIAAPTVPVLFKGQVSSKNKLQKITEELSTQPSEYGSTREGVVVRMEDSFDDANFSNSVMKLVRTGHVNTDVHWKHQKIIKNKLAI
jgi:hypothetical protein